MAKSVETSASVAFKRPRVISTDVTGETLTFTVAGASGGPLVLDCSALSDDLRQLAMLHGFRQKVSDAAALGKDALPDDKRDAMLAVIENLQSGDWSQRSGDGSAQPAGLIFRAFYQWATEQAAERGTTVPERETVRAKYDSMTRSVQLGLRNVPRIAAIMDEMRSSSVSAIDTDDLLAELGID